MKNTQSSRHLGQSLSLGAVFAIASLSLFSLMAFHSGALN